MSIIVQKFGGTSVADSKKILAAARKAIRAQKEGHQVVMVVSAMGKNTDRLVELAKQITDEPPAREMDMLLSTGEQVSVALMAMAIHSLGHRAISLTGAQIGIITDSIHTKARIRSISTERMRKALDEGNIVIAAGFQGIDESTNITTLGRGGSDTTAVALAAVLRADACEIYTDVDGVYTTDPRIVPEARRVKQISYDEMLELATAGAGVMHNRSIEFAKKFNVPVHVRSSFSDNPGTMIVREPEAPGMAVCGAAMAKDEARVTVLGVPDRPGAALSVFSKVAAQNIALDMIVQNEAADGRADHLLHRLPRRAARHAAGGRRGRQGTRRRRLHLRRERLEDFRGRPGHGHAARRGRHDVPRPGREGDQHPDDLHQRDQDFGAGGARVRPGGLRAVHEAFRLHVPPSDGKGRARRRRRRRSPTTAALLARLQRMEKLIIEGIDLDESQARVTFVGLPDMPGLAAQTFDELAEAGIVVDMIVQSIGRREPGEHLRHRAAGGLAEDHSVAAELAKSLGCPPPTHCAKVAKLSVFGVGMRSHTGVAARMFQSLARRASTSR